MVKVQGDGGLLIKCKDEKQREKAMKMAKVSDKAVEKAKKTGDGTFMKGVIQYMVSQLRKIWWI